MERLYFYKLTPVSGSVEPYSDDRTKNCRLTVNEIDHNFLHLQDQDIKDVYYDCDADAITLTRNDGEMLQAPLTCAWSKMTGLVDLFDVAVNSAGTTATITWKFRGSESGDTHSVVLGLRGNEFTGVTNDGSIIRKGTYESPVGINPTEKTGHFAPVKDVIDGFENLPKENNAFGTRYLTKEYKNSFGRLYSYYGVKEIADKLTNGWHVPSKEEWATLLSYVECNSDVDFNQNEDHIRIGETVGYKLKSKDYWISPKNNDADDQEPSQNSKNVDKIGFSALPGGVVSRIHRDEQITSFGKYAGFWTSTQTVPDISSDNYVWILDYDSPSIRLDADHPDNYMSLRLVKEYDGVENGYEYDILGRYYKAIVIPYKDNKALIWASENIDAEVSNDNQIQYTTDNCPDVKNHAVYVINEWDGETWIRKEIPEGSVLEVNNAYDNHAEDTEYRIVKGDDGELTLKATDDILYNRITDEIGDDIDAIRSQTSTNTSDISSLKKNVSNLSERVTNLSNDLDAEKQTRENTDNQLASDINNLSEKVNREIQDRTNADTFLSDAIDTVSGNLSKEIQDRSDADKSLNDAIDTVDKKISKEIADRQQADSELQTSIDNEKTARENQDQELHNALDAEVGERTVKDADIYGKLISGGTYTINVTENLTIPSYSGNNNVTLEFNGDFGTF